MQELLGLCEGKNGTKLINCCKPEQVGTQEYGKMFKRIQVLEERVTAKEARNWKIEGQQKRRNTRKEYQREVCE